MEYYQLYERYQLLVESSVEAFLGREGTNAEELIRVLTDFQSCGSSDSVTCIDYMLATTSYRHFLDLVSDFKAIDQWGADDETATGELLGGLEDEALGRESPASLGEGGVSPSRAEPKSEATRIDRGAYKSSYRNDDKSVDMPGAQSKEQGPRSESCAKYDQFSETHKYGD